MDLYLASGNAHKVNEFRQLLKDEAKDLEGGLRIHSAKDIGGMPEVSEDTGTFEGNARKKVEALLAVIPAGAWAFSDDSGVCVDALGGAPGVESAYFAGPKSDPAANLAKLVEVMTAVPEGKRQGHFRCVLCVLGPDREPRYFDGRCDGRLALAPCGDAGFGYDPIFIPDGEDRTYSELGDAVKRQFSHRARAWRKLMEWVRTHQG